MKKLFVWGTQLELQAAADYHMICIYLLTYQIDMFDTRKRCRIFHVNMLRKWHTPNATSFFAEDDDAMDMENEEVVMWRGDEVENQPVVSKELDTEVYYNETFSHCI